MKRILYTIAVLACTITGLTACTEEDFTTFQGEKSGIYMANGASYDLSGNIRQYTDSINFSFASYKPAITKLDRYITVRVMGATANYDRPFTLKVDETSSTAIRGTHFDYSESDCVIPANAVTKELRITIYRHEDLSDKTLRVEFYLADNDHFTAELESYKNTPVWNSTGGILCGTRFKVAFSELYTVTEWWSSLMPSYLGTWSASKEKRVNAIMGWSHADWEDKSGAILTNRMFAARQMQRQLQALANAGTPVIDDDGKFMQLSKNLLVDYSAYQ